MRSIVFSLVVLVSLAACDASQSAGVDWSVVQNRLWIEKKPTDPREMVKQLVLIDDDGQRVGAAMTCSSFRYLVDLLTWQGKDDQLHRYFLQAKQERTTHVRSWACKGEAPAGFELCLQLSDGKHERRLYSMKDWVIESIDEAAALSKTLAPAAKVEAERAVPRARPLETDETDDMFSAPPL